MARTTYRHPRAHPLEGPETYPTAQLGLDPCHWRPAVPGALCPVCDLSENNPQAHLWATEYRNWEGRAFLLRLCDGTLVRP